MKEKTFVCEICKCVTPISCEGGQPNVCAMCVPIDIEIDLIGQEKSKVE